MNPEILKRLVDLKNKTNSIRPLIIDTSQKANDARSLAWLLFDNAEEILEILSPKENNNDLHL